MAQDPICDANEPATISPRDLSLRRNVNNIVQPLLTDLYQITMAYAYWKSGKKNCIATFDLFFRKNPFNGEFTVFAGLHEVLLFLQNFRYTQDDINYLKSVLSPTTEEEFFNYLLRLDTSDLVIYAIEEGTVVFPKEPLMRVQGPLPLCQLLETTLLTLVNYASLMTTNASRYRIAAGPVQLLEFGLRRAQGPDGGLSASRYAYIGGFDATSNVLAGKLFGIPVRGTHAHAFVMSYTSTDELPIRTLTNKITGGQGDFIDAATKFRSQIASLAGIIEREASSGEFAAFIAYAISFPDSFLALIDTYDVIRSGLPNFCAVALALDQFGYKAIGLRIDSGDLAYLSNVIYKLFEQVATKYSVDYFNKLLIVASNDINEDTIMSMKEQGHHINCYGIGTHLVTCQRQPALGCVYKLVQVDQHPVIKLSQEVAKVTIPGRKVIYRLYGADGLALIDLMQLDHENAPRAGDRVLCRHPFQESKRAYVTPSKVELILKNVFEGRTLVQLHPNYLNRARETVASSLRSIRSDTKRYLNPTPFKVSVSETLYDHIHKLWLDNAPIGELK